MPVSLNQTTEKSGLKKNRIFFNSSLLIFLLSIKMKKNILGCSGLSDVQSIPVIKRNDPVVKGALQLLISITLVTK